MNKKLIPILILFISLFSSHVFAQTAPGDSGDGSGIDSGPDTQPISQPSPAFFKRNNGNGTCGGEGQIRVFFDVAPGYLPTILEIRYKGHVIPVYIDPVDASELAKKGYVSYCVGNTNLPPAKKLAIKFTYVGTSQTFWLMEDPF